MSTIAACISNSFAFEKRAHILIALTEMTLLYYDAANLHQCETNDIAKSYSGRTLCCYFRAHTLKGLVLSSLHTLYSHYTQAAQLAPVLNSCE
jgi:hypothetical protein